MVAAFYYEYLPWIFTFGCAKIISFLLTLVFQIAAVMLLPLAWGIDGIWASVVVAEFMAVVATLIFLAFNRKKYGY